MGKKIAHMVIVLGITGLLSGLSLAFVYKNCEDRIRQNEENQLQEALRQVLPNAAKFEPHGDGDGLYYAALDEGGDIIGFAKVSVGNGYQGKIKLIFGMTEDLEMLTGLSVFPNDETPGLGARITEDWFREQFVDLIPYPNVSYVKGKDVEYPNQIQAITGATISSKSVVNIVNDGLDNLLPQVSERNPERVAEFSAVTGASPATWDEEETE